MTFVNYVTFFVLIKQNFNKNVTELTLFCFTVMENTLLRSKLVVLGDAACGKSSLVQVFHSDSQQGFPKAYSMTTGMIILSCTSLLKIT